MFASGKKSYYSNERILNGIPYFNSVVDLQQLLDIFVDGISATGVSSLLLMIECSTNPVKLLL